MKRKILSVMLTVVLALGVVFTAVGCGSALDIYKTADKTYAPYAAATKVEDLNGFEVDNQTGNLVLLSKLNGDGSTTRKIFNLNNGTVIATMDVAAGDDLVENSYDLINISAVDQTIFKSMTKKSTDEKATHKLYNAAGTEVASITSDDDPDMDFNLDLVQVDDTYYRVGTDGSVVKAFEISDLSSFNTYFDALDYKIGNYYYIAEDNIICVFDENGSLVSFYKAPAYALDVEFSPLSNGNVFVQFKVAEDMFGVNYDYIEGNAKYTIEQKIINPKNGEAKDVKDSKNLIWFYEVNAFSGIMNNGGTQEEYLGSIKNFARGYKIVDGKKDNTKPVNFDMSNDGKLTEIEDFIPAQAFVAYKNGYYIVANELLQVFLYNSDAKLVGEISGVDLEKIMTDTNVKFLFTEKAIYDYSLTKVLDLEDYEVEKVLESTVILSKVATVDNAEVVEYYLLKEGSAPVKIGDEDNFVQTDDNKYYVVVNTEDKLECYNEVGTKILTVDMPTEEPGVYKLDDSAKMLLNIDGVYYYVA